ncbi:MAG: RloB family protein [Bacteroidetes bacterium]|nr:RloB family protein [Bacteroidota bacterium]
MARKIKLEPAQLRRFERQEARRQKGNKQTRKHYLIVCEGEKTEPNYFVSLKSKLPKGVLDVVDFKILGEGYNTTSLVERALQIRKEWESESSREVDKLWIVFDKDSFLAESFNNAVLECERKAKTKAAWSNEAFELWYLLHFEYYDTGITRDTYKGRIQENFRKKGLTDFIYAKNRTDMFDLLTQYGSQTLAIKNATRLLKTYEGRKNFADQKPCTTVHELVIELFSLEGILKKETSESDMPPNP